MKNLERRIDQVKKAKNLTYKDLGEVVGVSGDAINKAVKRGNVREFYLMTWSEIFGINKTWLETGEGDMLSGASEPVTAYGQPKKDPLEDCKDRLIAALERENKLLQILRKQGFKV